MAACRYRLGIYVDEVIDCYVRIADAIVREARLVMVGPDLEDARRRLAHIPDDRILLPMYGPTIHGHVISVLSLFLSTGNLS